MNESLNSKLVAQVVEVWSSILEQPVNVEDDFFDLGGDSLLALQVTILFQDAGHPDLPASAVMRWSTPRQFASALQLYS